ncbi:MAG TPA: N-acetylmuramoyl-L-alanine amidase, partial [Gammaproteobacteria bacterium]|nr:N-acetylmuramoyl-L-alanine amidase [Gammaproteobacteria bacterium]
VVFNLSSKVAFRQYFLKSPLRLVITLPHTRWRGKLLEVAPGGHFLRTVRRGRTRKGALQIVFDLQKPVSADSFVLKPAGNYPYRLVVDLFDVKNKPKGSRAVTSHRKRPTLATRSPARPARPRDIIIVIDAGHGGEDPGAIGHRRTREKTVVLSIAKRLQRLLQKVPGLRPELTRRGDYFISLRGRTRFARKKKADLFVSIHADSFPQASARGSSVYALSRSGASSEMGRWLARRENAADLTGGVRLRNKDSVVARVLLDMSMTRTITDGIEFGKQVLKSLRKVVPLHGRKVEQAGFIVLKSPDIPSILVETGFISNPREERKLRSAAYQNKIAQAVYRGIKAYIRRYKASHVGSFTTQAGTRRSLQPAITQSS